MTQNHYQVSISEVFLQESWSGGFRTGRPRRFGAVLGRKTTIRCLKCQNHHGSRRLLVYTLEEWPFFRWKSQHSRGPDVQSGQSAVFYRVDWGP